MKELAAATLSRQLYAAKRLCWLLVTAAKKKWTRQKSPIPN